MASPRAGNRPGRRAPSATVMCRRQAPARGRRRRSRSRSCCSAPCSRAWSWRWRSIAPGSSRWPGKSTARYWRPGRTIRTPTTTWRSSRWRAAKRRPACRCFARRNGGARRGSGHHRLDWLLDRHAPAFRSHRQRYAREPGGVSAVAPRREPMTKRSERIRAFLFSPQRHRSCWASVRRLRA